MHKLIEYVCDELEELERKVEKGGKLSTQEVQYMDTLAHTKKNLLKSEEMMGEDGYSMDTDGGMMYSNARNSRMMYSRARNGRGRGPYAKRDSMGRYSSDRYSMAEDDFRSELEDLMESAPNDHIRQKLQKMMSEM